ncbi:MAG TPA: ATP-binding protein, partial [Gammaproteobacteria bacterium]|nr:ATP-binding protein [Gammaproteobacteria bacterium]
MRRAMALPEGVEPRVLKIALPFCPGCSLYEFVALEATPCLPLYLLDGPDGAQVLDWTNAPVYALAGSAAFTLDETTVIDYLRFFFAHVVGRHGRFLLLESTDVPRLDGFSQEHETFLLANALPLEPEAVETENGGFRLTTHMLLGNSVARTVVRVTPAGKVDLDVDALLCEDLPVVPDRPTDAAYPGKPVLDFIDGWRSAGELDEPFREQLAASQDLAGPLHDDRISWQYLPFFDGVALLRIAAAPSLPDVHAYALQSARGLFPLNGESTPIFEAVERETFALGNDNVVDYLHFFCNFVHGDQGPFRIVTRVGELNAVRPPGGSRDSSDPDACPLAYDRLTPGLLETLTTPTVAVHGGAGGTWRCSALNQFGDNLFRNTFTVRPSGEIEMTDDEILVTEIPFDASRNRIRTWIQPEPPGEAPDGEGADVPEPPGRDRWPRYIDARRLESSILGEYVRLQLLRALRDGQGGPLVDVDPAAGDGKLLEDLARFVYTAWPVILIESPVSYIEQIVARLLMRGAGVGTKTKRVEAAPQDASQGVIPALEDGDTLTVSLHQWHKILRPEAAAYQLGVTDAVTLIGCDTPAVLPDALHEVVDIHLTLGAPDSDLFRTLFCRLFDCSWPETAPGDSLWQQYVTPGDFYGPVRDMLRRRYGETAEDEGAAWTADQALAAVRARVQQRLTAIEVDDGPGLDDLHGLGEARAILKDLLSDIRAAVSGEIPWDAVDRGMLLVGEPGVGKTLLARALARDSGVRFIHASEARWIAGTDGLSAHILAIRATFAEARRNTPCVLFIDELDSVGNRQLFEGRNKEYCTEIVNTLLQELQGVIDRQGVFVIGATNYLKYVDPALTRAGRLDQVVRVPRPDRRALEGILQFHLAPYDRDGRLDDDIDTRVLAGMALGATGADIEFFVRDA